MDNPETQTKLGTRYKTKTKHRKHKKISNAYSTKRLLKVALNTHTL
jgi:hypothetical protein